MFFVVRVAVKGLGSSGRIVVVAKTEDTAGGIRYVGNDAGEDFSDTHNRRPRCCVWSEFKL